MALIKASAGLYSVWHPVNLVMQVAIGTALFGDKARQGFTDHQRLGERLLILLSEWQGA